MKKILSALKTCLTVVALSGCATIQDTFPFPTLKQPLKEKQVTREFVFNKKTSEWDFVRPLPYDTINGMFCVSPEEYISMRNWYVKFSEDYTCKKKKEK